MNFPELTTSGWIVAAIAALCVGLSKSGFSGIGLFTILLLAQLFPAKQSTGAALPLLICGDVFSVLAFQRHARWAHIRRTLPMAMAGVIAGFFLMQRISNEIFRPVIGWIVLSMVILQLIQRLRPEAFLRVTESPRFGYSMGLWSGITTMMANAAGPVMTLYLLAVKLPKLEFVGTSAWFFLLVNVYKVPFSWHLGLINGVSIRFNLVLVPGVVLGLLAGRRLLGLIPQKPFELILLGLAAIASLPLIWS